MSPLLFALFINDLATDIKQAKVGIDTPYYQIRLLLYADDIVIVMPIHVKAQHALDIMSSWWGMKVNIKKSETVHVHKRRKPRCTIPLILDEKIMNYVADYKYLGCWVNEFGNNSKTVDALTATAGRSFGRIVNIFKEMGNMGNGT